MALGVPKPIYELTLTKKPIHGYKEQCVKILLSASYVKLRHIEIKNSKNSKISNQ